MRFKLQLKVWLLSALLTLRFCDSTSFTSSWPVCAGERVQFSCTVEDYDLENRGNTYWRTTNSSFNCSVSHWIAHRYGSYKDICGPFTAWLKKQGNNSYFSNFTAIATTDLNNSLVQCLGPNHRSDNLDLVGRDTIKITGPPSPPLLRLSAEWITETEDSNTFNITVHWDLPLTASINDNESFISGYVVTVRPQVLPCDNGSCVLTPGMREFVQRELTFSMRIGQTYNVTIRTENCNNSQPGENSNNYFITLQEPGISAACISYGVYNHSSNELMSIETHWSLVPSTHEIAPGLNESVTEYELSFRSNDGNIVTESAQSSTDCAEDTCAYSFIPWSTNGSSYHVTVAARNAVTLGQQQTCTPKSLSTTNNLLQVEVLESGGNVMIQCRLLAAITELVHCEARYGTDPSHHALPYRDTSNSAGLEGDVLTIHISHDLQSHTTYYYNISLVAVDGIISARVLHSIRIDCDPLALGTPLLASSTVCRKAESGLRTEHGTVCYTGRMQGALTYYSCDAGYQLASGEHGGSLRVCQGNGRWNDTATICVPLEGQSATNLNAGVGSAIAIVSYIVGVLSTTAVLYCVAVLKKRNRQKSENYYTTPPLPPRLQQQAKKEVEYEEVSVVVADGEHRSIELKSNAAYGPVHQLA